MYYLFCFDFSCKDMKRLQLAASTLQYVLQADLWILLVSWVNSDTFAILLTSVDKELIRMWYIVITIFLLNCI